MGPPRRGDGACRSCRAGPASAPRSWRSTRSCAPCASPYGGEEYSSRCRRFTSTSRCCTRTAPTRVATRSTSGPTGTSTTCSRWPPTAPSCRASGSSSPGGFARRGPAGVDPDQPDVHRRRRRSPVRRALHALRARLRARRALPAGVRGDSAKDPEAWAAFRATYVDIPEAEYRALRRALAVGGGRVTSASLAEVCVVACAEAWRGDGEILASPIGADPDARRATRRADLRARPRLHRRRRRAARRHRSRSARHPTPTKVVGSVAAVRQDVRHRVVGQAPRDDGRDADRPVRQPEHRVHRAVGEAQGAAPRRARRAGQHREPSDELLGAAALDPRVRRGRSTVCPASATTAPRPRARRRPRTTRSGASSPTSASSTSRRADGAMRLRSVHPGVTVDEVTAATAFPLVIPADVPRVRVPHRRGAAPHPRGPRPGIAAEMPSSRRSGAPHRALRPLRHRPSDRADRHGLGGRAAAHRGDVERRRARGSSPPGRWTTTSSSPRSTRSRSAPTSRSA